MKPLPDVLTLEDTAAYLKVSMTTMYRLVKRGDLPATKVGRQWRIRREAVEKYLREHE